MHAVRILLIAFSCLLVCFAEAQTENVKLISWNLQDMGRTKSSDEIDLMAKVLRGYDVIAIQEVVGKDPAGAQAIARLADAMDRTGVDYDYAVSKRTNSTSPFISERYAYLWRTDKIKVVGTPQLMEAFAKIVEREPYEATFEWRGKQFRVANFHARPHDKEPEREVALFKQMMDEAPDLPLFVVGDFNLVSRHSVFKPWLSRGYRMAVEDQKTTLRTKLPCPEEDCYAYEGDNIIVPAHQVQHLEGGSLDVIAYLRGDLEKARSMSDHVPVYIVFDDWPLLGD